MAPANSAFGKEAAARFLREVRAAANINHPNVCAVYDVGEMDGLYYMTMEYVEGPLLSDYVRRLQGQEAAAATVLQLAHGMAQVHAAGIIHRDLKPSNVILKRVNDRPVPVILDFGLARAAGRFSDNLTERDIVRGTRAYMSPEQARGEALGPATDIYSLGVILYELLTCRWPFDGDSREVFNCKIRDAEPKRPSERRLDLDSRLETICLKALAKRAADRYATMSDFATALTEYLQLAVPHRSLAGETANQREGRSVTAREPGTLSTRGKPREDAPRQDVSSGRTGDDPFGLGAEGQEIATLLELRPPVPSPGTAKDEAKSAPQPVHPPAIGVSPTPPPTTGSAKPTAPQLAEPPQASPPQPDTHARPAPPRRVAEDSQHARGDEPRRDRDAVLRLSPQQWAAIGLAAALVLLVFAAILFLPRRDGSVKIALSEPRANVQVRVDGNTITPVALRQPLRLRAGQHEIVVTGEAFETVAHPVRIREGAEDSLAIKLVRKATPSGKAPSVAAPSSELLRDKLVPSPADGGQGSFETKTARRTSDTGKNPAGSLATPAPSPRDGEVVATGASSVSTAPSSEPETFETPGMVFPSSDLAPDSRETTTPVSITIAPSGSRMTAPGGARMTAPEEARTSAPDEPRRAAPHDARLTARGLPRSAPPESSSLEEPPARPAPRSPIFERRLWTKLNGMRVRGKFERLYNGLVILDTYKPRQPFRVEELCQSDREYLLERGVDLPEPPHAAWRTR
jgi:serine/threonine protein kinase